MYEKDWDKSVDFQRFKLHEKRSMNVHSKGESPSFFMDGLYVASFFFFPFPYSTLPSFLGVL